MGFGNFHSICGIKDVYMIKFTNVGARDYIEGIIPEFAIRRRNGN